MAQGNLAPHAIQSEAHISENNIDKDEERQIFKFLKHFDLKPEQIIGRGSYGWIYKAHYTDRSQRKYYAVKVVKKLQNTTWNIRIERNILMRTTSDEQAFVVRMEACYHRSSYNCFVLDLMYCNLQEIVKKYIFEEKDLQFYIEEIVVAIEYLHSRKIIYKDLKPQNILINYDGHIRLCDFGISRIDKEYTSSRSGSSRYMAPEVHLFQRHGKEVDWWSMGVTMYHIIFRNYPFKETLTKSVLDVIQSGNLSFPEGKASDDAIDLISGLLKLNPIERIGWHGADGVKAHAFFKETCWMSVLSQSKRPPFIPPKDEEENDESKNSKEKIKEEGKK